MTDLRNSYGDVAEFKWLFEETDSSLADIFVSTALNDKKAKCTEK